MKIIILLLLSTTYFATAYVFPDIAYDQTSVSCDNANTLLALSTADLVRLKYDVDVIIPGRIARLDVAKRGVTRVCDFDSGATLLTQKSTSESKLKADGDLDELCSDFKDAIATLSDQIQALKSSSQYSARYITSKLYRLDDVLWSVSKTCNLVSGRLLDFSTTLLQVDKKSHLKNAKKANLFTSDGEDLDQYCQAVTEAIDNISDYLEALKSNVQSTYIKGVLPSRIASLTQTSSSCTQSNAQSAVQSAAQSAVQSAAQSYVDSTLSSAVNSAVNSAAKSAAQSAVQAAAQSYVANSLPSAVSSAATSAAQSAVQSAAQSYVATSLPSAVQSAVSSAVSSAAQSAVQSYVDTTLATAVQSYVKSSVTYPSPTIVRLADSKVWSYSIPHTESTLGPFSYKVSLTKDTLIECLAEGHIYSNSRRATLRFFVDSTPMGTATTIYPSYSHGMYLLDYWSTWGPLTYSQMAVVPKGDHTISFRAYTDDTTGAAAINGLEVVIKINNT